MKLRNKKTGEIIETDFDLSISIPDDEKLYGCDTYTQLKGYTSLAELNEEWEDYEETDKYWFINPEGEVTSMHEEYEDEEDTKATKEIGNYFLSREEAELVVCKLKALKQLKDNGMKKYSFRREKRGIDLDYYTLTILAPRDKDSLDMLFGGEE